MATARKWETKKGKKEYQTKFGKTDYDIPMFGYKSALLIAVVSILSMGLVPEFFGLFMNDVRIPTIVVCGIINGFAVAYTQFFIERKKGFCKSFYVVWTLIGLFVALMQFLLFYAGVFM